MPMLFMSKEPRPYSQGRSILAAKGGWGQSSGWGTGSVSMWWWRTTASRLLPSRIAQRLALFWPIRSRW